MNQTAAEHIEPEPAPVWVMLLKVVGIVFVLALVAILIIAWTQGDQSHLPFEYEGFDK